ncbi:hypothetical protein P153DRAFT_411878 [Dothidotthia symphoricarpi CBS 119687]|uniref:Uncharacterized protein n=1 Tax=Dothidotthia symphoricarpi CBS 119687 TaxID=1392245 RepID=A0A6A6A0K3_9PLEO|nr:uncharacterized protein P153DRAFT_411878 [Dothidotthia symphoricarpi CBS 119687]KAF2124228.1 hypothetical protein P153DRAFT_411878 [Dothidotthia symphoricarpi CBS 119687]
MFPRPRRDNTALPKPLPENTATREYYGVSEDDAPQSIHDDIDYPESSASPGHQSIPSPGDKHTRDNLMLSRDENAPEKTTSPTPSLTASDVVLGADLEDFAAMSKYEAETRGTLSEGERKRVLTEMQEKRRKAREERREKEAKKAEQGEEAQLEKGSQMNMQGSRPSAAEK